MCRRTQSHLHNPQSGSESLFPDRTAFLEIQQVSAATHPVALRRFQIPFVRSGAQNRREAAERALAGSMGTSGHLTSQAPLNLDHGKLACGVDPVIQYPTR